MAESTQKVGAALSEARTIIDAAQKRAGEILREAEQERAQFKKLGYDEGLEQARLEVGAVAVRLLKETGELTRKFSNQLLSLSFQIASHVIGVEIASRPEILEDRVKKVLAESVLGDNVTIVLHPDDMEHISRVTHDFEKILQGSSFRLEPDSRFHRGGCLVRTEFGEVDLTIESLLSAVRVYLESE